MDAVDNDWWKLALICQSLILGNRLPVVLNGGLWCYAADDACCFHIERLFLLSMILSKPSRFRFAKPLNKVWVLEGCPLNGQSLGKKFFFRFGFDG